VVLHWEDMMAEPIVRHVEPSATSRDRWGLLGCELLTLAALVGSLVSMAPGRTPPARVALRASVPGPREAYAACAHFLAGGAMPRAPGMRAPPANIGAWQWARLDDGRLRVLGYADAKTPVGKQRRTYYQCDLVQLDAGRWRLDNLSVSAQPPT
jgi:hypothetical protein